MSNTQRTESPSYAADTEVSISPRSLSPIPRRYNQNNEIDDITLFLQSHTFEHRQDSPNVSDDDVHITGATETLPSTIQPTLALTSTSEVASPVYSPDTSMDMLPFDRDVSVHFGMNDIVEDDDIDYNKRDKHYGTELDFYDEDNNGAGSSGNEKDGKIYDFYDYENDTDYTVDSDSGESQPGSQQRFFHFNHELKERLKQCHEEQQQKEAKERRTNEQESDAFMQRKRTNSLVYNTSNYNSHTIIPPKLDARPSVPSVQLLPLQTTTITQGSSGTSDVKVPIVTTRKVPQNSPPKYSPPPPPPPSRQPSYQPSVSPQNMSPTLKQSSSPHLTSPNSISPNSTSPRNSPPSPTATQPKHQVTTFTNDNFREKVLVPPTKTQPQPPNAQYIPGYDKGDEYTIEGDQNIASSVPLFPKPNQKLFAKSPILMRGKSQELARQQQRLEEHAPPKTKERSTSVTSYQRPVLYDQKHVWAKAVYGHLDLTPQKSFSTTSPNQSSSPAPATIQQGSQPPLSPKFSGLLNATISQPQNIPQQQQQQKAAISTGSSPSQPQRVPAPTGYTNMHQSQSPKGSPSIHTALSASPSYHMRSTSTSSQPQKVPQQRVSRSTGTSPSQRQWALRLTTTAPMGPVIVTPTQSMRVPSTQSARQTAMSPKVQPSGTSPKLTDLMAGQQQQQQQQFSPSVSPRLQKAVTGTLSQPQRVPQGTPQLGGSAGMSPTQPLAPSPSRQIGSRAGSPSSPSPQRGGIPNADSPTQVILPAAVGSLTWQRRHLQPNSPNLQALTLEQQQPLQPLQSPGGQQQPHTHTAPQGTQQPQPQPQPQPQQQASNDPVLKMIHGSAGQQFTTIVAKPPARAGTFRPEFSVKPCRFFGVHLQNLSREQLTRKFVPNIVERSLDYLEVTIINRVEGGKAVYTLKGNYPRISTWTTKDTQYWLETEFGLSEFGQMVEANRLTGKRLLTLTEREANELFGDSITAERVMGGIELTDSLQHRGDNIVRGVNMDADSINELFGLVDMWNSSVNQVVDYFKLKSTPSVVCALLKQYLRDLPVPLVPLQLFSSSSSMSASPSSPTPQQLGANNTGVAGNKKKLTSKDFSWNKLLQMKQNFIAVAWETLSRLIQFLNRIAFDEKSLVPVNIIADAFGPALFKPQNELEEKLSRKAVRELVKTYSDRGPSEDVFNKSMTPREFMYGEIIVSGESNVRCYFGPAVPCTLQGADYAEFLNARHWINGVVYFTNYRIVWEPNFSAIDRDKNIAYTFAREIPIASVTSINIVREPADKQGQGAEVFAGKIATRNLGVYYFQFNTLQTLMRFTEEVARSKEIAPFAWANKELDCLPITKRKELGWNIYHPEKRLGKFIGEDKGFFLQDTLKLYSISSSDDVYPRNCVVSSLILPNFMTLIKAHRLVPVLTWASEQSTTDKLRGVFRTVIYRSKNYKYRSCLFKKQALKDEETQEEREEAEEKRQHQEEEEQQQLEQLKKEEVLSSKPSRLSIIYKARRKSLSKNTLAKMKIFEEDEQQQQQTIPTSLSSSPTSSIVRRKEAKEDNEEDADTTNWAMFYKAYEIRMVLVMDSTGSSKPGFLERQGSVTLEVPGFTAVSRRFIRLCNMFINYQNTEEWMRAQREAVGQWTSMIHDILFSTVMVSNMISSGKNSILLQPASNEEDDMISALSSLAAIMVDGKTRTIEGFVELIEREWIDFGFPYAKSHGDDVTDITVNTTVLIVFLDCVWQLWTCFPESFEFNEALLLFIAESIHSGRFGTFYTNLCCASCAAQLRSKAGIPSLWAYILTHKEAFTNPLCTQAAVSTPFTQRFSNEFVAPNFWAPFYMRWKTPTNEERYARQLRRAKRAIGQKPASGTAATSDNASEQLDFANLGLAMFPQVPVPYAHLAHIKDLNLSRNRISSLPSSLYFCSTLAQLDISRNNLRAPFSVESIRALSKHVPDLTVLDISYNNMECLPANFAELSSVRKLCIGGNNFKEVPKQIFELRYLRSLSLESGINQASLSSIPFSRLDALEELNLSRCGLTDVPSSELMSMKSLRILNLSYNELTSVDNFPCIPSLKILDLSYNKIASLPLSFSSLVNLVDLNVRHNRLTELTPAIGQLKQLSRLVIDENNLKSLPPTLSKLPFLGIGEFIHGNGLFPPECNTNQKKLANLQSLLTRKLGNPAVGKTVFLQCLVKKYKRHSENMQTISTDGVDITPWHFDWKDESGEVRSVNAKIWDFAGQVIYTSTHHFFLTSRGIYVLVWKLPLGDAQCRLSYWLNLISITTRSATVYIVGTHTDSPDMNSARVDKIMTEARARYTRMYPQLNLYFRAISNLTKEGLRKVREEIKETICASLAAEEPVPYQYLMLENQISKGRRVPPVLSRKEWEMTARCCDINTEAELSRATEFLHASGSLICFQRNAALRNYVILDPQWMTNTLSTVITHKHNWVKNGILRKADLVHIWKAPEFPAAVYPVILDLLEAFNVIFWLPAKNVPHILDAAHSPDPHMPAAGVQEVSPSSSPSLLSLAPSSPTAGGMTSPVRASSGSSNSTTPPLSSPTTMPVPSPSPTSSLSSSPSGYGLSPAARIAHQRQQQQQSPQQVPAPAPVPETQNESVIFLPALLPETAPDYSKVWRKRHLMDEEEIGRRFSFQCLPESLFSKLLVIFSHTYNFFAIWRNGVVMEVRGDGEQQRGPNGLRSVILIRQSIEANTLDVHIRYSTVTGGNEIVFAGELFQNLLEVIGRTIRDWYKVKVAAFVMCSSCLERGLERPFLCRHDRVEGAISEGLATIRCAEEGADIPLTKMAPDMVIGRISAENRDYVIPFSDLTLLNVVGEGAAASVYKAQYKGEVVAVKMFKLEREGLGMFADQAPAYDLSAKIAECRREMAVMSKCRMPNVLRLVGFVTRPLCLVIEYADGGSLYSYIHDTSKPLEWPLRLKFAVEVASALQKLHSSNPAIIHRDLKSPNVLLKYPNSGEEEGGVPKAILCDFGLSGRWESQSKELAVENPIWTAPEVLRREDCTTKSDVYSLGVILWELLTREGFMSNLRFMGEIADAVIAGTRPQIPEVPEEYGAYATLIEKCWDPEPIKRPMACNIVAILSSMIKSSETN